MSLVRHRPRKKGMQFLVEFAKTCGVLIQFHGFTVNASMPLMAPRGLREAQ
jgi:hypothetical protein